MNKKTNKIVNFIFKLLIIIIYIKITKIKILN